MLRPNSYFHAYEASNGSMTYKDVPVFEKMRKEAALVSYNVLFQYLCGVTEENQEHLSEDGRSLGQVSNPVPPEFKAVILA
jgi:hypothetical protein